MPFNNEFSIKKKICTKEFKGLEFLGLARIMLTPNK